MLETQRLILRQFTLQDVEAFFRLGAEPRILEFVGKRSLSSLEDAKQAMEQSVLSDYQRDGFGRLACIDKASNQITGFAGLKRVASIKEVDIGYRFFPEYWGQGLATEVANKLMEYGKQELKLQRIVGIVDERNIGSVRVLQKLGMTFEKHVFLDFTDTQLALYA